MTKAEVATPAVQDLERLLRTLDQQGQAEALAAVKQVLAGYRLQPVCQAVEKTLSALVASGEVTIEDLEQVQISVLTTEAGEKVIKVTPRRKGRARSGNGVPDGRLTKDAWMRAGFQAFVVGSMHYAQPLKAIEAAGGEIPMDPATGKPKPENWWRGIALPRYFGLGIKAIMAGKEMPLEEAARLAKAAA